MSTELLPLHLYFPASVSRDFYVSRTITIGKLTELSLYCKALIKEIGSAAPDFEDFTVPEVTISFGTPSLLRDSKDVPHVLAELKNAFHLAPDCRFTWLLDPELATTIHEGMHLSLPENGRVLLHMLSSSDDVLSALRYPHTFKDTVATVEELRKNGVTDLSVMLLTGAPADTAERFRASLKAAADLGATAILLRAWNPEDKDLVRDLYETEKRLFLKKAVKPTDEVLQATRTIADDYLPSRGYHEVCPGLYQLDTAPASLAPNASVLGLGAGAFTRMDGNSYRNTEDLTRYEKYSARFEMIACDLVTEA